MFAPGRSPVPRLSIVLPVLGPPVQMEDALVSVLENRPSDCEILVVHNEPYDDPYDLKNEVCFIEAPRDSRWVDAINLGLAVSRSRSYTCSRATCGSATGGPMTPWCVSMMPRWGW